MIKFYKRENEKLKRQLESAREENDERKAKEGFFILLIQGIQDPPPQVLRVQKIIEASRIKEGDEC